MASQPSDTTRTRASRRRPLRELPEEDEHGQIPTAPLVPHLQSAQGVHVLNFTLRRGLVVAPKRGRVVLFSGGGENIHTALPVRAGRRQTIQAFFKCTCVQPPLSLEGTSPPTSEDGSAYRVEL